MLDFETVRERIGEMGGVDTQKILDFIEDMKQANTSLYYTEAKRTEYRAIDLSEVRRVLSANNGQAIRAGMVKGKIIALRNTKRIEECLYF
jgi:hypothetical protein